MSGQRNRRKRPQTTHHRDTPDSLTITRERHAFEGQSLAVVSSIRRRGVLLVLVVLPDGSRSLIPANWTDWNAEQARRTPADDAGGAHDLGRLGDLLQLRKIIDALYDRPVESVQCKESSHATEPGLSRTAPIFHRTPFQQPRRRRRGSSSTKP